MHILAELAAGKHGEDHLDGVKLHLGQFLCVDPAGAVHNPENRKKNTDTFCLISKFSRAVTILLVLTFDINAELLNL